ncbi:MAG TPA: arginine repressor [Blastocatellia bacterium]|jgi:transcriptional regulator of arginine metabolism|nr:arginine repressor [Blastocatellia bacterium]
MKRLRQEAILQIIAAKHVATQQELAEELARKSIYATQSSVSRDIVELGLTKLNGYYTATRPALSDGSVVDMVTAGDNLIVIKTDIGQATPAALAIDRAKIDGIIGTIAGDDTIFIAVKSLEAQRLAMKKLVKLFAPPAPRPEGASRRSSRPTARTI